MDHFTVIVLAVVQGVAEFLPISSSGHLVIGEALFAAATGRKLTDPTELNIALHAGTLASIAAVYWRRIWRLLGQDRRVVGLLFVATLPAVVVGLPVRLWWAEGVLENALLAGCMLPVTGLILIIASRRLPGAIEYQDLTYRQALAIGLFQAAALLPGISRSGTTIAAGLFVGLRREATATFSFLLALPVIGGACLLEVMQRLLKPPSVGASSSGWLLLLGAAVSAVVGVLALRWLLAWLQRGRLQWFAAWCIPVGLAVVAWQLTG